MLAFILMKIIFAIQNQKRGSITYNGHALHEFVPQKTSAYISQDDLHIGELTVRETLDFSALSQGVGSKYGMYCPSVLEVVSLSPSPYLSKLSCCWQI